jgi:hypothetical protein
VLSDPSALPFMMVACTRRTPLQTPLSVLKKWQSRFCLCMTAAAHWSHPPRRVCMLLLCLGLRDKVEYAVTLWRRFSGIKPLCHCCRRSRQAFRGMQSHCSHVCREAQTSTPCSACRRWCERVHLMACVRAGSAAEPAPLQRSREPMPQGSEDIKVRHIHAINIVYNK